MINTVVFKTKTAIDSHRFPGANLPTWPVAVDIGYSSVKMVSPNRAACIPSYVLENTGTSIDEKVIGSLDRSAIAYRGKDGREFWVGQMALDNMAYYGKDSDTSTSMYVRDRYAQDAFKILAEVGMALGLQENQYGNPENKPVSVQTGLPPKYLSEDAPYIKEAFAGDHEFDLRIGKDNQWHHFSFTVNIGNVNVMSQPMGTLFAIMFDANGGYSPYAKKILQSDSLVFDPGFGTLDLFHCKGGAIIDEPLTRKELGMRAVFERCGELIKENRGLQKAISIDQIESSLYTGIIKGADPAAARKHMPADVNFAEELEQANHEICENAMKLLDEKYNYMSSMDYLVVTGGTGSAWLNQMKNCYGNLTTLHILPGNQNFPNMSNVFANVIGYYMSLYSSMKRTR